MVIVYIMSILPLALIAFLLAVQSQAGSYDFWKSVMYILAITRHYILGTKIVDSSAAMKGLKSKKKSLPIPETDFNLEDIVELFRLLYWFYKKWIFMLLQKDLV